MWRWMSGRPPRCLKIGVETLAWAELSRGWSGRQRYRCVTSHVPDGLVRPSPVDPNLLDLSALESRIQALVGSPEEIRVLGRTVLADRPRPVTLLLPDAAVRAVVLHLDQVPTKAEERDALIRWRFSQEQLFPLAGTTVVSQVFGGDPGGGGGAKSVLVVAVHQAVLSQYESICERAGLVPQDVGTTSLRLFNLWASVRRRTQWQDQDLLWVGLVDRALTTMVFQRGRLMFYRCKLLAVETLNNSDSGAQKIVEECQASLEVCLQRYPSVSVTHAVVCAEEDVALEDELDALSLSLESLTWTDIMGADGVGGEARKQVASLAALAGVLS